MNLRLALLPISIGALLSSCTPYLSNGPGGGNNYLAGLGVTSPAESVPVNPAEASSFWDGDSIQGSPSIRINRAEQKAYFYKSGELVGMSPVSTGTAKHRTPPGTFKVTQKNIDHSSSAYGKIVETATDAVINDDADSRKDKPQAGQKFVGAPMPYFMRFNHGIGMHTGHLPGYAASHGCVRLPNHMARKFFEHAEVGTPVIVE